MTLPRRSISTQLLLVVVLAGTISCDRVTKRIAAATLAGGPTRSLLADTVRLDYAENTGGFLSLGSDLPAAGRAAVFVVTTGAMLCLAAFVVVRERIHGWALLGATLFIAGGISNWIDRAVHGRVVDFLNFGIGPVRTGVFNVADMAIMAGLALLIGTRAMDAQRQD